MDFFRRMDFLSADGRQASFPRVDLALRTFYGSFVVIFSHTIAGYDTGLEATEFVIRSRWWEERPRLHMNNTHQLG